MTVTPRKYGFHGTLKPPFRLADGATFEELKTAVAELAQDTCPAQAAGLELSALGRFLALTPTGDMTDLSRVAGACVRNLDQFRAPASQAELDRRRQSGLTPRQEAHLLDWGYPYVFDDFKFHLTLTGRLPAEDVSHWRQTVLTQLPDLPTPFEIADIALCGEREDGFFELIHRYALSG